MILLVFSLMIYCLTVKAQLAENNIMTVKDLFELAQKDNLATVQQAVAAKGYKSRGGKSVISKCFAKDCTLNGSNQVTAISNVNTASTVNYSPDDGGISVTVFTTENLNELLEQVKEEGYEETDSSGTMKTYRKQGAHGFFHLITYKHLPMLLTDILLIFLIVISITEILSVVRVMPMKYDCI